MNHCKLCINNTYLRLSSLSTPQECLDNSCHGHSGEMPPVCVKARYYIVVTLNVVIREFVQKKLIDSNF